MVNTQHQSTSAENKGLVLFISDLHLCESRPHITQAFLQFLKHEAANAHALYILGDLFEYWAGDDAMHDDFHQTVIHAFATLAKKGVALYLMHGNRDFLMAEAFCQAARMTLMPDPSSITLFGQQVLLSHGDALCTDDAAYQTIRVQFRNPIWQENFLSQPLATRKSQIEAIRMQSEQAKAQKSLEIMDVNQAAVDALLISSHYPPIFIHGHTHRPAQHLMQLDGHTMTRWVLGDWYEQGSYLAMNENGCYSVKLN